MAAQHFLVGGWRSHLEECTAEVIASDIAGRAAKGQPPGHLCGVFLQENELLRPQLCTHVAEWRFVPLSPK